VLGVLLPTRLVIHSRVPVEQTEQGRRPPATLVASFDGLGVGLQGPHGRWEGRNPSDNSLAVVPDFVVQIVNTRIAIFRKNGAIVYGPVPTNSLFKGFGGACEAHNNGDAVVRYDQLADRWLIVRSEEHTSELQSRGHLVCRLLLEKKKSDNMLLTNLCMCQLH